MLRAEAPQNLEAVDSRQADIEHDQVERRLVDFIQSSFAIVNCFRIMASLGQRRSDLPRHRPFIFNNQDSHGCLARLDD